MNYITQDNISEFSYYHIYDICSIDGYLDKYEYKYIHISTPSLKYSLPIIELRYSSNYYKNYYIKLKNYMTIIIG